jgi:hypothetical protein
MELNSNLRGRFLASPLSLDAKTVREQELILWRTCNKVAYFTKREADIVNVMIGKEKAVTVPLFKNNLGKKSFTKLKKDGFLFVGGFDHFPNKDGMIWFLNGIKKNVSYNNIIRDIKKKVPKKNFKIFERNMDGIEFSIRLIVSGEHKTYNLGSIIFGTPPTFEEMSTVPENPDNEDDDEVYKSRIRFENKDNPDGYYLLESYSDGEVFLYDENEDPELPWFNADDRRVIKEKLPINGGQKRLHKTKRIKKNKHIFISINIRGIWNRC